MVDCDALPEEPGAFRRIERDGRSYILVRDEHGRVRCFLNQCRHRGARLESRPAGKTRVFVCPYHAWSYGTDGSLRQVPRKECFSGVDPEGLGLVEVDARVLTEELQDVFEEELALAACRSRAAVVYPSPAQFDVQRYVDAPRFDRERSTVLATHPVMALHASELDGDAVDTGITGQPVRLQRTAGNPGVDARDRHGRPVGACIHHGFVWLQHSAGALDAATVDGYLGEVLTTDLRSVRSDALRVNALTSIDWNFNWKLAVEAALESYHFRITHAKTLGGAFDDRSSLLNVCGPHHRAVVPRNGVKTNRNTLRDLAFLTYHVFPNSLFFVNRRHCDWLRITPMAVNRSRLTIATLVPAGVSETSRSRRYIRTNHEFTCEIVHEDSEINLSQQRNFEANPDVPIIFGGLEGALTNFNRRIDDVLAATTS